MQIDRPTRQRTPSTLALLSAFLLALSGCGGGGSAPADPGDPPTSITYSASSFEYRTEAAITPEVPTTEGGLPTSFEISPTTLPAGLSFDGTTGRIAGTPTELAPTATYEVMALNADGDTTTDVDISVRYVESKSIAPMGTYSDDDVRHFMERTQFGFRSDIYAQIQSQGLPAFVNTMTQLNADAALETAAFEQFIADDEHPTIEFPSQDDLIHWWTHLMLRNPNPWQEVQAMHWHDHFATGASVLGGSNRYYMHHHIDLLRKQGMGDLRTLLLELARDKAMLVWLNGIDNNAGGNNQPNENFGREWFELFCLGVDNGYTQTDIVEAARAFSGYRQRYESEPGYNYIVPELDRHDTGAKVVLGMPIPADQTIEQDYVSVRDATIGLTDPTTGRSMCALWIVRSILRRFCYEEPEDVLVNQLAEVLETNGWQLKSVFDTLFLSEAFYCDRAKEGFVKMPTEQIVGFIHASGLYSDHEIKDGQYNFMRSLRYRSVILDNIPTSPPGVDGWPEDTGWLSGQAMVDRANVTRVITYESQDRQQDYAEAAGYASDEAMLRDTLLPTPTATGEQAVDELIARFRVDLTAAERQQLIDYMNTDRGGNGGTEIGQDPFDPSDDEDIDERVRGLLYILAQHPSYLTR